MPGRLQRIRDTKDPYQQCADLGQWPIQKDHFLPMPAPASTAMPSASTAMKATSSTESTYTSTESTYTSTESTYTSTESTYTSTESTYTSTEPTYTSTEPTIPAIPAIPAVTVTTITPSPTQASISIVRPCAIPTVIRPSTIAIVGVPVITVVIRIIRATNHRDGRRWRCGRYNLRGRLGRSSAIGRRHSRGHLLLLVVLLRGLLLQLTVALDHGSRGLLRHSQSL